MAEGRLPLTGVRVLERSGACWRVTSLAASSPQKAAPFLALPCAVLRAFVSRPRPPTYSPLDLLLPAFPLCHLHRRVYCRVVQLGQLTQLFAQLS